MKSLLLVVLLAAAATAAVVSYEEPDLVEVPDMADGDEFADENANDMSELDVTDVAELTDVSELTDENMLPGETAVATRRSLSQGTIGSSKLVYNNVIKANGVTNHYQQRDITVRTNKAITAIRVTRLGNSQNATPSVRSGGLGRTSVTIRIRSATGRGYHYRIRIYTR